MSPFSCAVLFGHRLLRFRLFVTTCFFPVSLSVCPFISILFLLLLLGLLYGNVTIEWTARIKWPLADCATRRWRPPVARPPVAAKSAGEEAVALGGLSGPAV